MSDTTSELEVVASLDLTKSDLCELLAQLDADQLIEAVANDPDAMGWADTLKLFKYFAETLLQSAGDIQGAHPDDWDSCNITSTIEELYTKFVLDHSDHKTPVVGSTIKDLKAKKTYSVTSISLDIDGQSVFICKEEGNKDTGLGRVISLVDIVTSPPGNAARFYLFPKK